jgi:hypothetical protein
MFGMEEQQANQKLSVHGMERLNSSNGKTPMPQPKAKNSQRPGMKIDPKFVPKDVREIVITKQNAMREHCTCTVSQETAIYAIIRESKNGKE